MQCIEIVLHILSIVKMKCVVWHKIFYVDEKFCQNLKMCRRDSELTQKQVANKLGVVESCYANWEQGRTEPNIDMLRKLGEIFQVSLDELINGL